MKHLPSDAFDPVQADQLDLVALLKQLTTQHSDGKLRAQELITEASCAMRCSLPSVRANGTLYLFSDFLCFIKEQSSKLEILNGNQLVK